MVLVLLVLVLVFVIAAVIAITQGVRKIYCCSTRSE